MVRQAPWMVRCTPSIVGVWFSLGSLHTSKVLAATARVITAICVLSFIFCSFFELAFLLFGRTGNCGHQGHVLSRHCLQDVFSGKVAELSEINWGSGEGTDSARIGWRLLHGGGRS